MERVVAAGFSGGSSASPRALLAVDCAGALLSAVLLGVVLMRLERVFGMPADALVVLAAIPVVFAVYDAVALAAARGDAHRWLLPIGLANLGYCLVSVVYVLAHAERLRVAGWVYFVLELVVVVSLAGLQLRVWWRRSGR